MDPIRPTPFECLRSCRTPVDISRVIADKMVSLANRNLRERPMVTMEALRERFQTVLEIPLIESSGAAHPSQTLFHPYWLEESGRWGMVSLEAR